MMKRIGLFLSGIILLSLAASARVVDMPFDGGQLRLDFMRDNAVRVQFGRPCVVDTLPDFVYDNSGKSKVSVKTSRQGAVSTYRTPAMTVSVDTLTHTLSVTDAAGKQLTRFDMLDIAGGRATLSWHNGEGDNLYGLGQFQDGYSRLNGLSRRLTQVNTQISIPMLLSTGGYGVLWNNYGLVEFNPCTESVALTRGEPSGDVTEVSVTTTEGSARELRSDNTFSGTITVPGDGAYALLLDVGQRMARKHNLTVNGDNVIDMSNVWLPPTTSTIVDLNEGDNVITAVLEKDDRPVVWYRKVDYTTTLSSPVASNLDFTIFAGDADAVIASQRSITGGTPMMPAWALGYIHCRERFHSQDELLGNAAEFRRRGIPADVIVQDWQYWGRHGWNAMRFDEANYPEPLAMTDSLHAMDMRLMLSVWSKIDPGSEVGKQASARCYYIPGTQWIDFFNPEAASFYWTNFSDRLLRPYRIDAWWQDATEPENDDLAGRRVMDGRYPGELFRNVYPLLVNKTVYEGCRADDPSRRTMILTRCGFPGIQRYGAAMWSGDVGYDWKILRTQILAGQGMMSAGMPWWTYDAGGFFRPRGQYSDPEYAEMMTRWIQTSVFLPLMRVHGYMSDTEPWRYDDETARRFTDAISLRYSLLPYIYSLSHRVAAEGYTLMRPLAFDYPDNKFALGSDTNFMFGPAFYVAPVLMSGDDYNKVYMHVYLPDSDGGWYDFNTGSRHEGRSLILSKLSPDYIPVYVKAGSIIPRLDGKPQSSATLNSDPLIIEVYPGADGTFTLYEDAGDNYDYERGAYATVPLTWYDRSRTLEIGDRKGRFDGMSAERDITVRLPGGKSQTLKYSGKKLKVNF